MAARRRPSEVNPGDTLRGAEQKRATTPSEVGRSRSGTLPVARRLSSDVVPGAPRKVSGTQPSVRAEGASRVGSERALDESRKRSGTLPKLRPEDELPRAPAAGQISTWSRAPFPGAVPQRSPQSRAPRSFSETRQGRALGLTLLGLLLAVSFTAQALLEIDWPELSAWQKNTTYKMWTGSLLAVFIGGQWLLTLSRVRAWGTFAKVSYTWHQRAGVLAPAVLLIHSTRFGFGYLAMLSGLFIANTLVGLLSPRALPKLRRYTGVWLSGHVALSLTLVVLVLHHVWVALFFE